MNGNKLMIVGITSFLIGSSYALNLPTAFAQTPTSPKLAKAEAKKTGFNGLSEVISLTTKSVDTEDFAKAKTEFSQFENNWKTVEDALKTKSKDHYNSIEDNLTKVNSYLKASKPDKVKLLSALKALDADIIIASKLK